MIRTEPLFFGFALLSVDDEGDEDEDELDCFALFLDDDDAAAVDAVLERSLELGGRCERADPDFAPGAGAGALPELGRAMDGSLDGRRLVCPVWKWKRWSVGGGVVEKICSQ